MKCYSFKLLIVFLNTELFISRRYIQQFKNGRDHSAPWNCYINVAFLNNRYNVLENLWFLCDVSYTFACIRTSQACNIPEMGLRDKVFNSMIIEGLYVYIHIHAAWYHDLSLHVHVWKLFMKMFKWTLLHLICNVNV